MASKFYAYLGGVDGPLSKITAPTIGDLWDRPMVDLRVPMSQDGIPAPRLNSYVYEIGISAVFAGPGPSATERDIRALANHLNRGGFCAFALAHGKMFCGQTTLPVSVGDTVLTHGGNAFGDFEINPTLADGDEVVVEDPFPSCRADIYTVASHATRATTIDDGVRMDFQYQPLIRERYTYPVLYRGPGQDDARVVMVKPMNGHIYYRLDMELVYAPALAFAAAAGGDFDKPTLGGYLPGLAEGGPILRKDTTPPFQETGVTFETLLSGRRPNIVVTR